MPSRNSGRPAHGTKPPTTGQKHYGRAGKPEQQVVFEDVAAAVFNATGRKPTPFEMQVVCASEEGVAFDNTKESILDCNDDATWDQFNLEVFRRLVGTMERAIAQQKADEAEKAALKDANKAMNTEFWAAVDEIAAPPEGKRRLKKKEVAEVLRCNGLNVPGTDKKARTPIADAGAALAILTNLYAHAPVILEQVAGAIFEHPDRGDKFFDIVTGQDACTELATFAGEADDVPWYMVDNDTVTAFDPASKLDLVLRGELVAAEINRRLENCAKVALARHKARLREEELEQIVDTTHNLFEGDATIKYPERKKILAAVAASCKVDDAKATCAKLWAELDGNWADLGGQLSDLLFTASVQASERPAVLKSIQEFTKIEIQQRKKAAETVLRLHKLDEALRAKKTAEGAPPPVEATAKGANAEEAAAADEPVAANTTPSTPCGGYPDTGDGALGVEARVCGKRDHPPSRSPSQDAKKNDTKDSPATAAHISEIYIEDGRIKGFVDTEFSGN